MNCSDQSSDEEHLCLHLMHNYDGLAKCSLWLNLLVFELSCFNASFVVQCFITSVFFLTQSIHQKQLIIISDHKFLP